MARVVVTGRIPSDGLDLLKRHHEVTAWDEDRAITREELLTFVRGADGLVTLLTERVDGELLDAAGEQLRVVANVAVGYNNIDVDACVARGVTATNTPGVLTEATADTAFTLMLMATRRFGEGERVIRSRTPWQWGMFYLLGMGIQGKVLGIVGAGAIGIAMARRAMAFGMSVLYTGPVPMAPEVEAELGARRVEFGELLRTSDVVSLHCPYLPETHHLMGAHEFELMKPTAYLVNSARGPIVDEAALVAALQAGELAGAGLDVFENEPSVHEGLLGLDNVVLLPHLGSATTETRTAMAVLAADNAIAVLAGRDPVTPVTPVPGRG
jgi:glyoxylate reductase